MMKHDSNRIKRLDPVQLAMQSLPPITTPANHAPSMESLVMMLQIWNCFLESLVYLWNTVYK